MADIVVYPYLNPRLIEVLAPATEITIQELHNKLRDWEDSDENASFDELIDSAGKEPLGGGVAVGITATLQNAQLMFSGRTSPLETGTCSADDSSGTILFAYGGQFETSSIYAGCTVYNETTGGMAAVTIIDSETMLHSFPLAGGSRTTWLDGDLYKIYPNEQCTITGGNLVAIDGNGAELAPVRQSPNVQVIRSSSSSATLMELEAIQYSSFGGGVTVDPASPWEGTEFPMGTREYPVNNLQDAVIIGEARGLTTFYILGDITIDTGYDYTGLVFVGESIHKSALTVSTEADVTDCEFYDCTLNGVLDGGCLAEECRILDLNYINGIIKKSLLGPGTITLGGGSEAIFLDCYSGGVAGVGRPTIDCGGSGQDLVIRNYNGGIILRNKTGADDQIVCDLNSGVVVLESTVTAGIVIVRGVGVLEDSSNGATVTSDLLNTGTIASAVWDEPLAGHTTSGSTGSAARLSAFDGAVWIDTVSGSSGTTYPTGTQKHPVNNIEDALVIAAANNIRQFKVRGSLSIADAAPVDISGYRFEGFGLNRSFVELGFYIYLNEGSTDDTVFKNLSLAGNCAGEIFCIGCEIPYLSYAAGYFVDCFVTEMVEVKHGTMLLNCTSRGYGYTGQDIDPTVIAMNSNSGVMAYGLQGDWKLDLQRNGYPARPGTSKLNFKHGSLLVADSCSSGTVLVDGNCIVTDESEQGCAVIDNTLAGLHGTGSWEGDPADIVANAVWDEARYDHVLPGTFGATSEWTGDVDIDLSSIADAVWDEALDGHLEPGTTGKKLYDGGTGDPADVAAAVWDAVASLYNDADTMGRLLNQTKATHPRIIPGNGG